MPLVVEYLGRPEVAASGYLLDGFPRSADQAEVLLDAKLQSLLVNPATPPICTAANLHRRLIWLAGKARVLTSGLRVSGVAAGGAGRAHHRALRGAPVPPLHPPSPFLVPLLVCMCG